jgi:cytochrome c
MTTTLARLLSAATLAAGFAAGAAFPVRAEGDPVRGKSLYESRCIGCHSLDANRVGPKHRGVFGRRAGSVADFDYSPALSKATIVWGADTLDRWLADPQTTIPGQRMNIRVAVAADRADLIAFLKRESGK